MLRPEEWDTFLPAFERIPSGCHRATFRGKSYVIRKSQQVDGLAEKLQAEELGGTDFVSFNLYRLSTGALLRPCEMPQQKVMDFVLECRVSANSIETES